MNIMKKWLVWFCVVLCGMASTFVVQSPAKADSWPFISCWQYTTQTFYAYGSGANAVYASDWYDYSIDNYGSDCWDINVEDGTTGHITVRVQFCPKPPPAPQFTCFADGWGTTPTNGIGVASHYYNFPGGGSWINFYYRMETRQAELFYRWI